MIKSILDKCFHKEKLNILTCPTHERYESNLSLTGHNFYAYRSNQVKDWNENYAKLPENYVLLNKEEADSQVPEHINFDLVLSQNKFGQFQILSRYAQKLNIPLISLEHTAPAPFWPKSQIEALKSMKGDLNIFISDWSKSMWGWGNSENTEVIHHGINTDIFKPLNLQRGNHILTTVNEYSKPVRAWCIGFDMYLKATKGLPAINLGDDPPHSKPAKNIDELVKAHNESAVFLNTSTFSPIPTSLLEAMACGSVVVSTATCMIPNIINHGINGFLVRSVEEMRHYLIEILNNRDKYNNIGLMARQTIIDKFSLTNFVDKWNKVFKNVKAGKN